jgi:hypothetical protein
MGEREELLSKLKRYWTIRDRISDELTVAVIEELIREIEERLRQIENSQNLLQRPSGEVPQ